MITTDSSYIEIRRYLEPIEEILHERANGKAAHFQKRLKSYFAAYPNRCIDSDFYDCHYTQDGIRFTVHAYGLHQHKGKALYVAKGFSPNPIITNGHVFHFFLPDIHTGKKTLIIRSDRLLIMVEAHALSRYRQRFIKNTDMPFEEVAKVLIHNNPAYHFATFSAIYGTKDGTRIMSCRCLDGAFLGYFDKEKTIVHFTTFISDDMLTDRQYYHSKDSDICKRFLPIMESIRFDPGYSAGEDVVQDCKTDVLDGKTVMVEMSKEEFDEMIAEAEKDPEGAKEAHRAEVQRQKFEHQKRYKLKMKKKGYK